MYFYNSSPERHYAIERIKMGCYPYDLGIDIHELWNSCVNKYHWILFAEYRYCPPEILSEILVRFSSLPSVTFPAIMNPNCKKEDVIKFLRKIKKSRTPRSYSRIIRGLNYKNRLSEFSVKDQTLIMKNIDLFLI